MVYPGFSGISLLDGLPVRAATHARLTAGERKTSAALAEFMLALAEIVRQNLRKTYGDSELRPNGSSRGPNGRGCASIRSPRASRTRRRTTTGKSSARSAARWTPRAGSAGSPDVTLARWRTRRRGSRRSSARPRSGGDTPTPTSMKLRDVPKIVLSDSPQLSFLKGAEKVLREYAIGVKQHSVNILELDKDFTKTE